ncbi:MAG: DNA-binding protein WhiA [Eubacterium sp.]|nr:DNA-binding protein WhiA [Eubacterium sp.]
MSFSSDLKSELFEIMPKSLHCRLAELSGIISISGRTEESDGKNRFIIRVENDGMEDKTIKLLKLVLENQDIDILKQNQAKHHRKLIINNEDSVEKLKKRCKLQEDGFRFSVNEIVSERNCCKASYIRGAFLAGGSVGDPKKSNQLEIAAVSKAEATRLVRDLKLLGLSAKSLLRRDRYIVYIKDGNTISDLIGMMGATSSLMVYEEARIVKDVRNNINREVNCESANIAKTVNAAAKQMEDIKYIDEKIGLDKLPDNLKEMAKVRIENPYLPLAELGGCFIPPLGKSGISHRLRKLSQIADDLRNKEEKL